MGKDEASRRRAAEKRKKRELEMRKKKTEFRRASSGEKEEPQKPVRIADLPLVESVISKGFEERGLAHILLARRHADGTLAVGGFYVDTLCLGIKDSALIPRIEEKDYRENVRPSIFNDPVELIDCPPELARAVAEGAAEFADRYGFRPNKRWDDARKIFQGIGASENAPVFGREGKPCFVKRGESNAAAIIAKLARKAGEGNYTIEEG